MKPPPAVLKSLGCKMPGATQKPPCGATALLLHYWDEMLVGLAAGVAKKKAEGKKHE
jgi:hypothetical protein